MRMRARREHDGGDRESSGRRKKRRGRRKKMARLRGGDISTVMCCLMVRTVQCRGRQRAPRAPKTPCVCTGKCCGDYTCASQQAGACGKTRHQLGAP